MEWLDMARRRVNLDLRVQLDLDQFEHLIGKA